MARGRGWLSGIQLLPEEASPIIAWAADELRKNERTQIDIYKDFHSQLVQLQVEHHGELEFKIPSFQAFNRYSLKLAAMTRRMEETREIAGAISKRFDAEASDDLTLIAAEAIKTLVFELLTAGGEAGIDPKSAMNLATALRAAAQAQGVSTTRRIKVEKEFGDKVEQAVEAAAGVAEKEGRPIDAAHVLDMIRKAYRGEA